MKSRFILIIRQNKIIFKDKRLLVVKVHKAYWSCFFLLPHNTLISGLQVKWKCLALVNKPRAFDCTRRQTHHNTHRKVWYSFLMGLDNSHLLVISIGMLCRVSCHDPVTSLSRDKHPFNQLSPLPSLGHQVYPPSNTLGLFIIVWVRMLAQENMYYISFSTVFSIFHDYSHGHLNVHCDQWAAVTERDTETFKHSVPIHGAPNESSNMVRDSHLIRAVQVFRYSRLSTIANPGMAPA